MNELAKLLAEYGPWAVVAVCVFFIRVLYKDNQRKDSLLLAMAERTLPLLGEVRKQIEELQAFLTHFSAEWPFLRRPRKPGP